MKVELTKCNKYIYTYFTGVCYNIFFNKKTCPFPQKILPKEKSLVSHISSYYNFFFQCQLNSLQAFLLGRFTKLKKYIDLQKYFGQYVLTKFIASTLVHEIFIHMSPLNFYFLQSLHTLSKLRLITRCEDETCFVRFLCRRHADIVSNLGGITSFPTSLRRAGRGEFRVPYFCSFATQTETQADKNAEKKNESGSKNLERNNRRPAFLKQLSVSCIFLRGTVCKQDSRMDFLK